MNTQEYQGDHGGSGFAPAPKIYECRQQAQVAGVVRVQGHAQAHGETQVQVTRFPIVQQSPGYLPLPTQFQHEFFDLISPDSQEQRITHSAPTLPDDDKLKNRDESLHPHPVGMVANSNEYYEQFSVISSQKQSQLRQHGQQIATTMAIHRHEPGVSAVQSNVSSISHNAQLPQQSHRSARVLEPSDSTLTPVQRVPGQTIIIGPDETSDTLDRMSQFVDELQAFPPVYFESSSAPTPQNNPFFPPQHPNPGPDSKRKNLIKSPINSTSHQPPRSAHSFHLPIPAQAQRPISITTPTTASPQESSQALCRRFSAGLYPPLLPSDFSSSDRSTSTAVLQPASPAAEGVESFQVISSGSFVDSSDFPSFPIAQQARLRPETLLHATHVPQPFGETPISLSPQPQLVSLVSTTLPSDTYLSTSSVVNPHAIAFTSKQLGSKIGHAPTQFMSTMSRKASLPAQDFSVDSSLPFTGSRKRVRVDDGNDETPIEEEEKKRTRGRPRLDTKDETAADVSKIVISYTSKKNYLFPLPQLACLPKQTDHFHM